MAILKGTRYRMPQQDDHHSKGDDEEDRHVRGRRKNKVRVDTMESVLTILAVLMVIGVVPAIFLHGRHESGKNPSMYPIWSVRGDGRGGRSNGIWDLSWKSDGGVRQADSSGSPASWLECTASPLEGRLATPQYGCDEMEEMFELNPTFLGDGHWRDVYLVNYRGQNVAYKELKEGHRGTQRNRERHQWEAAALEAVSNHKNIVGIVGRCGSDIVTEYYPNYMDKLVFGVVEDGRLVRPYFNLRKIVVMALDAASGLQALHEATGGPIVHSDLQPKQLLLDDQGVVKINDLNRCRFMGRGAMGKSCPFNITTSNGVWRSPEEYLGGTYLTEKIDIYSMGMIFWSFLGRDAPFERDEQQAYKQTVISGGRPYVDPMWDKDYVEIFQDMWQGEPSLRPSAGEIVRRLEGILRELKWKGDADHQPS